MNRPGSRLFRGLDDAIADEVAFRRGRRADVNRLIRFANVRRSRVRVAVHCHGPNAQLATCTDDAHCDLAAVGDENLVERRSRPWQNCSRPRPAAGSVLGSRRPIRVSHRGKVLANFMLVKRIS